MALVNIITECHHAIEHNITHCGPKELLLETEFGMHMELTMLLTPEHLLLILEPLLLLLEPLLFFNNPINYMFYLAVLSHGIFEQR